MNASIDIIIYIYMNDYLVLDLLPHSASLKQTLKLYYHKQIYITIINLSNCLILLLL